jgi:hypothetical protein
MSAPNEQLNEYLAYFLSGMTAVMSRLIRATERPSKSVILGEVLIGLAFCFILAPAVQEKFGLSTKAVCAITWAGSYFSGLILKGIENIIKSHLDSLKKLNLKTNDNQ